MRRRWKPGDASISVLENPDEAWSALMLCAMGSSGKVTGGGLGGRPFAAGRDCRQSDVLGWKVLWF